MVKGGRGSGAVRQEDVTQQTSWPDITMSHNKEQKMWVSLANDS